MRVERKARLDEKMWKKFFDKDGRLTISTNEVKEVIFHGVSASFLPQTGNANDRALIMPCDQKYGNSCWDYIRGTQIMMKEKPSDVAKETNTSV